MTEHWVNTCERNPEKEGNFHVIQTDVDKTINRTKARWVDGDWVLSGPNAKPGWLVVAWLEADRPITDVEALKVHLEGIRSPYLDNI